GSYNTGIRIDNQTTQGIPPDKNLTLGEVYIIKYKVVNNGTAGPETTHITVIISNYTGWSKEIANYTKNINKYHRGIVSWNTTDLSPGKYNITVNASITDDAHPWDNERTREVNLVAEEASHNLPPVANFTYQPENPATWETIYFNSTSYDLDGSIVNHTWSFGDGETAYGKNVTHNYKDDGVYTINLTVKDNNNATSFIEKTVTIRNQPPIAKFTYEPEKPVTYSTIYFNSTSTDLDGRIVNWTWSMGDGTILYGEKVTHQYMDDGVYMVNLTVRDDDNATSSTTKNLLIKNQPPNTDFNYEPIFPSTYTMIYFNSTSYDKDGNIVNYTWSFGDGETAYGENVTHLYTDDGTYNVNLTIIDDDGAHSSIEKTVFVNNQPPVANFTFQPNAPVANDTIYFNSTSYDIDGYVVNWTWDFGDGETAYGEIVAHSYEDNKPYNVTLTVTDDDNATVSIQKTIDVGNQPPIANFTFEPTTPSTYTIVYFSSTSYDSDGEIVIWRWEFDDGYSAYGKKIKHSFTEEGVYNVKLVIKDDDGAYSSIEKRLIIANRPPVAGFTYTPLKPTTRDNILFNSTSYDLDGSLQSWVWSFGDGSTAHGEKVVHRYQNAGVYTVTLTVTDNKGLKDSFSILIQVGSPSSNLSVKLSKPKKGYIYMMDRFQLRFSNEKTIVVGPINVSAEVNSNNPVEHVMFYVNDVLKTSDSTAPYYFMLNEKIVGNVVVKVVAEDVYGEKTADEIEVFILNLKGA
ncbi:MAG TPA: PKD domain-containing protein, partial [Thermoplasmatales archaeon]|nr:PKD domain-containing protein [Thermoplasmatales archaeon]